MRFLRFRISPAAEHRIQGQHASGQVHREHDHRAASTSGDASGPFLDAGRATVLHTSPAVRGKVSRRSPSTTSRPRPAGDVGCGISCRQQTRSAGLWARSRSRKPGLVVHLAPRAMPRSRSPLGDSPGDAEQHGHAAGDQRFAEQHDWPSQVNCPVCWITQDQGHFAKRSSFTKGLFPQEQRLRGDTRIYSIMPNSRSSCSDSRQFIQRQCTMRKYGSAPSSPYLTSRTPRWPMTRSVVYETVLREATRQRTQDEIVPMPTVMMSRSTPPTGPDAIITEMICRRIGCLRATTIPSISSDCGSRYWRWTVAVDHFFQ